MKLQHKVVCGNANLQRLIESCWHNKASSRPVAGEVREVLLAVAKEVSSINELQEKNYINGVYQKPQVPENESDYISKYSNLDPVDEDEINSIIANQWQALAVLRKREEVATDCVIYDDDEWDEIGKDWAFI